MPGRIIPEPPPPDDDPEHLAEERELARSAHLAGLAVQRTTTWPAWSVASLTATPSTSSTTSPAPFEGGGSAPPLGPGIPTCWPS
jgi:hypothetical protein